MSKSMRLFLPLCGPVVLFSLAFAVAPPDDTLTRIMSKLNTYTQYRPQEKLYLHIDKPLYVAGEDVWFKTYLVDATFHKFSSLSRVVYVELLSADNNLIQRQILFSPSGTSHGDFHLADSLPQGRYLVRAYTNYMKNTGEDFFFKKEITILNSANGNAQLKRERVGDLQFFPEGGTFLTGVENRIAFKAIDPFGKGIPVEGVITDENDQVVTSFKSEHDGMGMIQITPLTPVQYKAKITTPPGFSKIVALPPVEEKGYILRVSDAGENIRVVAYSNMKKFTPGALYVYLVAQSRGITGFAAKGEIKSTALVTSIPKNKFPSGITQITLFDEAGIPQCERLIFVDHHNTLHISAVPDKKEYAKREHVELDIETKDNSGHPLSGDFSVTIYDITAVKDDEQYPSTIVNNLLLTSDLKGRIENPGYYFKDDSRETSYHRDLLMMTHGWRRFTWKQILADTIGPVEHYWEKGIAVSGNVLKSLAKKPAVDSDIRLLTSDGTYIAMKTDSLGRFYTDNLLYYDSIDLIFQTNNAKGKQVGLQFHLNPFTESPPAHYVTMPLFLKEASAFPTLAEERNRIMKGYKIGKEVTMLEEVEVTATKEEENAQNKIYGTPDATLKMDEIGKGYSNVLQALQGRVAGLVVTGAPPNMSISIRGGGTPLIILDGMPLYDPESSMEIVSSIPVGDVESIDILKGANAAMFGGRGGNGVIAIYTKRGGGNYGGPSTGIHTLKYPGFYRAREFYSPDYSEQSEQQTIPDLRTTLYWNPTVVTDTTGRAHVSFYTSDVTSSYKIIVEGMSYDGMPGCGNGTLEVE